MRAMTLREHGGPEVLRLEELPDPVPGPGEVRVRVRAVALNRLDLWVRRGLPHLKLRYPFVLGCDIAGVVDGVGPSSPAGGSSSSDGSLRGGSVRNGDEVLVSPGVSCGRCRECLAGRDNLCREYAILGENRDGGYADYVVVPRANLLPAPPSLSWAERASLPLVFLTAWQMVVRKARVEPGQIVLVHAAGSGVGSAAVQIVRLLGADVIATASSDEKLTLARGLGATHTVRSDGEGASERLLTEVKRITARRGVDVVIEHTGAQTWPTSILATRRGGRIVTCGATSGWDAHTDLRHVFFRQLEILGSTMGSKADLFDVLDHVRAGRLKPVLDRTFTLEEAPAAHRRLEERAQFGKIALSLEHRT